MATTRKSYSQSPAAVRAREARAKAKREQQDTLAGNAPAPLYEPDEDAPPEGRRGPGRPPQSYRRPSLREITANLIAVPNSLAAMFFPKDALSRQEIVLLADALSKDPWTGPYIAKSAAVGEHTELLNAITVIVMGRLVERGLIKFGEGQLGALFAGMMGQQPGEDGAGGNANSAPDAGAGTAAAAGFNGIFGGPGQPAAAEPWRGTPVPVGAG